MAEGDSPTDDVGVLFTWDLEGTNTFPAPNGVRLRFVALDNYLFILTHWPKVPAAMNAWEWRTPEEARREAIARTGMYEREGFTLLGVPKASRVLKSAKKIYELYGTDEDAAIKVVADAAVWVVSEGKRLDDPKGIV